MGRARAAPSAGVAPATRERDQRAVAEAAPPAADLRVGRGARRQRGQRARGDGSRRRVPLDVTRRQAH